MVIHQTGTAVIQHVSSKFAETTKSNLEKLAIMRILKQTEMAVIRTVY